VSNLEVDGVEKADFLVEKRRSKRRHLVYYLKVYEMPAEELLGYMLNISPAGIMLLSDKGMKLQKEYSLKMLLPQVISGKDAIEFRGVCVWSQTDLYLDFYANGFQITEITEENTRIIETLIQHFSLEE
jgi:hypothetical protein